MGLAAANESRRPKDGLLYPVAAEHLETFLARQAERDRPVPCVVEREFGAYQEVVSRRTASSGSTATPAARIASGTCTGKFT
jgi:hypothetical protein